MLAPLALLLALLVPADAPARPAPLNALDFGAAGDGHTNDGPALQLAFNAAAARSLPLVLPPGDYLVDVNPVLLAGANGLKVSGPGRLVYGTGLYRAGLNCPMLDFRQCSDLTLEGLSFLGTGQAKGFVGYEVALRVACDGTEPDKASERIQVLNCRFEGFRGPALLVSSGVFGPANKVTPVPSLRTSDVVINGCAFRDNAVGFLTKPGGLARLRFTNNTVAHGGLCGIKLDGEGQAGTPPSGPALVAGNTFDDFDSAYCAGGELQAPVVVEEFTSGVLITGNLFSRVKAPNAGALWVNNGQSVRDATDVTFADNLAADVTARSLLRLTATAPAKVAGVTLRGTTTTRSKLTKATVVNDGTSPASLTTLP